MQSPRSSPKKKSRKHASSSSSSSQKGDALFKPSEVDQILNLLDSEEIDDRSIYETVAEEIDMGDLPTFYDVPLLHPTHSWDKEEADQHLSHKSIDKWLPTKRFPQDEGLDIMFGMQRFKTSMRTNAGHVSLGTFFLSSATAMASIDIANTFAGEFQRPLAVLNNAECMIGLKVSEVLNKQTTKY